MIRTRRFWLATLLVSSCSSPPPAPPPIPPISGPQPIDGTYHGLTQTIRGSAMNCGNQDEFAVTVTNHTINFNLPQPQAEWKPVVPFSAVIGPDGSFNAQSGTSYLRGTLSNGHMQGEISGDICGFAFNADRDGTF
jgi:hypothetical protein